jgi:hypothetical protein
VKPPSAWTADDAGEVDRYIKSNPDDPDVVKMAMDLSAYHDHEGKRAALQRDSSFTPTHRAGGMMGLRTLLPEMLGGIATTHADPSIEDFRKTKKLTPGDDEASAYQDFKDEAWAKAYDDAAQKGLPISRKAAEAPSKPSFTAERSKKSFDEQFEEGKAAGEVDASQRFTKGLAGVGQSYLDGMAVPGASSLARGAAGAVSPSAGKYLDEASDSIGPVGRAAAEIAGTMNPVSVAGKVAHAITGKPEGIIAGLGKGILSGAALGAGGLATNQGSKLAEDILRSQYKPGEAGDRLADTVTGLPASMLFGGLMGAVPGAAQGFSRGLRTPTTSAGRALRAFEETGGETSVTAPNGLKLPPTLEELVRSGGPFEHPTDNAVNRAKPLIAQGAAAKIEGTVSPIEAETERYYAATKGIKAKMTPMTKSLVELIKSRSYGSEEGGDLPMVNNAPLRKELHRTAEAVLVPNHEAAALEAQGGVRVPVDEAIASGMVDKGQELRFIGRQARNEGATMPPGADDAAAQAYLDAAGPSGAGPIPGIRSMTEQRASLEHLGEMLNPGMAPPRPPLTNGQQRAAAGALDPTSHSVVFLPKELDARAADEVLAAVDRAAGISEAEGAGRADPAFKKLPRAAREVRDQFPPVPGITDKYPDVSITGPDGSPITLTGRSAMAHAHSQQLSGMQRLMKHAGMPSERFDPTDILQQDKAGQALFGIGPGVGETNRTAAVMDLARRSGSDFDVAGKQSGQVANGDLASILHFLNGQRRAISRAERAGVPNADSDRVNHFIRKAQDLGAVYSGPVYRGAKLYDLEHIKRTGTNINTWSVSKDPEGAEAFARRGGVLFEIPGDSGAVPVDHVDGSNTFSEALIPKGAKWSIVGERNESGLRVVTLEPAPGARRALTGERAIKDVIASRLVNGGELAPKGVGVPSANPERAAAQLAHKYQYKLDPIAQFLGKGAPLAGASSVISDPVTRALLDLAQRTQQQSP